MSRQDERSQADQLLMLAHRGKQWRQAHGTAPVPMNVLKDWRILPRSINSRQQQAWLVDLVSRFPELGSVERTNRSSNFLPSGQALPPAWPDRLPEGERPGPASPVATARATVGHAIAIRCAIPELAAAAMELQGATGASTDAALAAAVALMARRAA